MKIAKGKRMTEITGTSSTKAQIKVLDDAGFAYWLDVNKEPCMYDGQPPNQKKTKQQAVKDHGFMLPNVAQSKY